MDMRIYFPGGQKVHADLGGMTVKTDQMGEDPAPFGLFLASIGTCAGIYVLGFCQNRGLPTEGIEIEQSLEMNPVTRLIAKVGLKIKVPASFPEKYHQALIRSANQCAVKKHLEQAPEFDTTVSVG
jgi:putative redox protein